MAKLYFKYGAMNSGKSTILMQSAHNYEERGMRVLVLKPLIDTKGENYLVSRLGVKRKVDYSISKDSNIFSIVSSDIKLNGNLACIFIDESQFLQPKQAEELLYICAKLDVPVICYGLRSDFLSVGFPGSTRLLEIAHSLEELKTICRCGRKALFNARKINGEFVFKGEQVAIDLVDNVEYESLCDKCYINYKENI